MEQQMLWNNIKKKKSIYKLYKFCDFYKQEIYVQMNPLICNKDRNVNKSSFSLVI